MEKYVHKRIKYYLDNNVKFHEVRVGNYIADVKRGNQIYEIQTQNFKLLLDKIEYYIHCGYNVTIVYPVINNRYIVTVDDNWRVIKRRKSAYKGVIQDSLLEIYWIHKYLNNDLFNLKILLVDVEDIKVENRTDVVRQVSGFSGELAINNIMNLKCMVPSTLGIRFTSSEFIKESKSRKKRIASGVKLLRELGIIKQVDKKGNTLIYERNFGVN